MPTFWISLSRSLLNSVITSALCEQQRDTVASIQRGTFSPDFDDDDGFDEDFASMLGGSQLGRTNLSTPNIGSADQSGISTYEMEDESKDEFEFDTDF